MKKAFFKLLLVILGLNVFTACYGPAPGWQGDAPEIEETEQTEETQEPGEEAEKPAE